MYIKKGDNTQASKNFKASEFYSKSPDAPESHFFDDKLIRAAQFLRDYYGVPMLVNSSFRTPKHNKSVGGATYSQHLRGTAVDLSFPKNKDALYALQQDILTDGKVKKELRKNGINGIGLYDNFIHIDVRRPAGAFMDGIGKYAFWDKRTIKKKS